MADISDLTDLSGQPLKKNSPPEPQVKEVEVNVDYKDKYLRALADFKNLQRQVNEERRTLFEVATMGVLEQLIPTLDMLHQAEVFVQDQGLKMVIQQFEKTITDMGLVEIDVIGKEFDPHFAEAVDTVEDEGKENRVIEVVKKGYQIGTRVVRVAQVKVSKKKS